MEGSGISRVLPTSEGSATPRPLTVTADSLLSRGPTHVARFTPRASMSEITGAHVSGELKSATRGAATFVQPPGLRSSVTCVSERQVTLGERSSASETLCLTTPQKKITGTQLHHNTSAHSQSLPSRQTLSFQRVASCSSHLCSSTHLEDATRSKSREHHFDVCLALLPPSSLSPQGWDLEFGDGFHFPPRKSRSGGAS